MRITLILCILFIFTIHSCINQPAPAEENFEYPEFKSNNEGIREVIYSMYLPTDMADVFKKSGTNYDPEIPASIEDITLYTDPEQIAVMLGVYGVDITYMKLLGQSLQAAQYYKAIEQLSQTLGIPGSVFKESSTRLEKYFGNEDSLANVIENIYRQTDQFFKDKGNQNLAALSLAGGWVEAMYIGTSIFKSDSGNQVMAERLLQQKYSLNSIYTILSNHQESLYVKGNLLMLKRLRKVFEKVDIMYQKEGFSVDTTQKKLQAYNAKISYDEVTMDEIENIIVLIRKELIRVSEQL